LVGSALNWQGQPHAQSQLTTSSPTILHVTLLIAQPHYWQETGGTLEAAEATGVAS
jgi:hypothetical protein